MTLLHDAMESVRAAARGAGLRDADKLLPTSDAATRAVALAAAADEEYVAAHKHLARTPVDSGDYDKALADATRAYAEAASRVASRVHALANNERACQRIVTEARTEQRGLTPHYFGPYIVALVVALALGLPTQDPRLAGIAFAIALFASALTGAAVARLRRRAFNHDLAHLIDPEAKP